MTICYFGDYDPEYIRNDVILTALRVAGAHVHVCNERGAGRYMRLLRAVFNSKVRASDVLFIGSSDTARYVVLLVRMFWYKPLVWDMHYSIYDGWVFDRELLKEKSVAARYHYGVEWLAAHAVSLVLLDTKAHSEYIAGLFSLPVMRCSYVLVGANEEKLRTMLSNHPPRPKEKGKFIVNFHGKYIPLQGVPTIIKAAKLLEGDTRFSFVLVGSGQTYKEVRQLADELACHNITFMPRIPYDYIPAAITGANVSLGIFGDTAKAARVIPNKLYEAVALGVPVVTEDSPAIREVFQDGRDMRLCRSANPTDLAHVLTELANDPEQLERIGKEGYATFRSHATSKQIGTVLLDEITRLA